MFYYVRGPYLYLIGMSRFFQGLLYLNVLACKINGKDENLGLGKTVTLALHLHLHFLRLQPFFNLVVVY